MQARGMRTSPGMHLVNLRWMPWRRLLVACPVLLFAIGAPLAWCADTALRAADSERGPTDALTSTPGNPQRGRSAVLDPDRGDCTICHEMPLPQRQFHGNIGPSLVGIATRLDPGEIRSRIVDPKRVDPSTLMPSYFSVEGRHRVDPQFSGRSILTAQEVEDVVAYLMTLTSP